MSALVFVRVPLVLAFVRVRGFVQPPIPST
jgi:hypothetical protein